MKKLFLLFILPISLRAQEPNTHDLLFDTQFLVQYNSVTSLLCEHGFQEGFFSTPDNLKLNYLYLERPEADFTVILAAGWLPGRKEGLATFYALLPESCNILFFDARGHGQSEGPLFSKAWFYGIDEYKDMIGALNFARSRSSKPIIVYGVCAGAFNSAHALIHLQKEKKLHEYDVRGFIFDSGWASVLNSSWTAVIAKVNESIARFWSKIYGKKWREVLETIPYKASKFIINNILAAIHTIGFFPAFALQDSKTNLLDKIEHLPMPILFIHSHDDEYVPIEHAQHLAKQSQNSHTWWIDKPSKHACHCLKHKDEYQLKMHAFLAECMQTT